MVVLMHLLPPFMNPHLPKANAELTPQDRPFVSEVEKFKKFSNRSGLTGLANDTKWNELLNTIRTWDDSSQWTPSFRFQLIDSEYTSGWDGEWKYHLPFPFVSVLWIEIRYIEEIYVARLLPKKIIDHRTSLIDLLQRIGCDFEVGSEAIRIFGYAPRSLNDFKK